MFKSQHIIRAEEKLTLFGFFVGETDPEEALIAAMIAKISIVIGAKSVGFGVAFCAILVNSNLVPVVSAEADGQTGDRHHRYDGGHGEGHCRARHFRLNSSAQVKPITRGSSELTSFEISNRYAIAQNDCCSLLFFTTQLREPAIDFGHSLSYYIICSKTKTTTLVS